MDDRCHLPPLIQSLMMDDSQEVFVTSNCCNLAPVRSDSLADFHRNVIDMVARECSPPAPCGAAIIHSTTVFQRDLALAHELASGLFMLPFREYTAIHIRAGGSQIMIEGAPVSAFHGMMDGTAQYPNCGSSYPQIAAREYYVVRLRL
jgi:hypothetical protein